MNIEHTKTTPRLKKARSERGASLVEYALLVALIAVVCIVAVTFMGKGSSDAINKASGEGCPDGTHLVPSDQLPFTTQPQDKDLTGWCLPN